jgi:hypothetical protein
MKKIKIYIAISFWAILCLFLFYQNHLDSFKKINEQKAIPITNQKIRSLTQKLHQSKLARLDIHIKERGNNKRDRNLYNRLLNDYASIKNFYETDISAMNLKSSLTDSVSVQFFVNSTEPRYNSKELKSIYRTNVYQNAHNLLGNQHYMFYDFGMNFHKVMIFNASDTTLGLFSSRVFFDFAEISKINTKILNAKYTVDIEGGLAFSSDFTEPIIFQVNTHTKTGIIEKRYRITTPKGQKIKPFDYEEIE